MKKTRNSFFAESNYQSYKPNMYMNDTMGAPYQASSNYFYQGPMPNNYTNNNITNDIENRLSKIERQLNRMDYRISKLENTNNVIKSEDFDTNNNNMYIL